MTDRSEDLVPRRALGALVTTVVGLVLLFSFKTPDATELANGATGDQAIVDGSSSGTKAAAGTATTDGTTGTTGATTDSTSTPDSTATPEPTATTTATTSTGYHDGTFTGDVISTRYGDVEVQVTIAGGTITDVTALELPSGDRRTNQISSQAEPILREEALTAQSAQIDLLSGATYTSTGYERSLQAALDQAAA
jgi:uncharacterized protein with FMN-binding domain